MLKKDKMVSCGGSGCTNRADSPPKVFLRKGALNICSKLAGEQPYRNVISIKLLCNFIEYIQALLWHIEPYSGIYRTPRNPCIYNRTIFKTLAYLEREASAKPCRTWKMIRHIQSPGILRTVYSSIFGIFRDIQGYWYVFSHTQALFFSQKDPSEMFVSVLNTPLLI